MSISAKPNYTEEIIGQRQLYSNLIQGLKTGEVEPSAVLDYETEAPLDSRETREMTSEQHQILDERINLQKALRETRLALEKRERGNVIADNILSERTELQEKLSKMNVAERQEYEDQLNSA